MTTPSMMNNLKTATCWGRRQLLRLLSFRRGQLAMAVLVGAILGGGLTAAASGALGGEHDGGPGHSVVSGPGQLRMDHSGYDAGEQ